jgi:hypothetical protein
MLLNGLVPPGNTGLNPDHKGTAYSKGLGLKHPAWKWPPFPLSGNGGCSVAFPAPHKLDRLYHGK